jgi:hypothetical protein
MFALVCASSLVSVADRRERERERRERERERDVRGVWGGGYIKSRRRRKGLPLFSNALKVLAIAHSEGACPPPRSLLPYVKTDIEAH